LGAFFRAQVTGECPTRERAILALTHTLGSIGWPPSPEEHIVDSTRSPLEGFFTEARRVADALAQRVGPELATRSEQWFERLHLVPKSEVTRLQAELDELTARVLDLENRLARLSESGQ
jgi:hypothetical protein